MTYQTAIQWMFEQLPIYQRQGQTAYKADLHNITVLTAHLHHPEKKFKAIHIAGTNGKGSVCHMLASIFQESGYKTGLHTSPHLKDFRERIKINGKMISKPEVAGFIAAHKTFFEKQSCSFFEMSVGMAFDHFAREKVDIAIIETGLGGRLDSTNIIHPELSIITNIGFDHMAILGDTLPQIAFEKAGIIKPHTPVVIGQKNTETAPVFLKRAAAIEAPLYFAQEKEYPHYPSDLTGAYQKENQQSVLRSIAILQKMGWEIPQRAVEKGLLQVIPNTGLNGRWQIIGENPKIICDTGHNKEGLSIVLTQLQKESYTQLHIVLGVVADKKLDDILPLFPKEATYYFAKAVVPRGLPADQLAAQARSQGLKGEVFSSVQEAFIAAKTSASSQDVIFVGGSTFTVAEVI